MGVLILLSLVWFRELQIKSHFHLAVLQQAHPNQMNKEMT